MPRAKPVKEDPRRLHLDKTVNLGHILTTLAVLFAGVGAWMKLDSRVITIETLVAQQDRRDIGQDAAVREKFETIRDELRDIKSKVDEIYRSQPGRAR
jgi:hypothetical protein